MSLLSSTGMLIKIILIIFKGFRFRLYAFPFPGIIFSPLENTYPGTYNFNLQHDVHPTLPYSCHLFTLRSIPFVLLWLFSKILEEDFKNVFI